MKQLDEVSLLRVDGALQMFQYLLRSGSIAAEPPGRGTARRGGRGVVTARPDLEFMPPKMEHATELLGELSRLIHRSNMADKDKAAARAMLQQIVLDIYQREVKDEWAELEEVGGAHLQGRHGPARTVDTAMLFLHIETLKTTIRGVSFP